MVAEIPILNQRSDTVTVPSPFSLLKPNRSFAAPREPERKMQYLLRSCAGIPEAEPLTSGPLWQAEFFALSRAEKFQQLDQLAKKKLLHRCGLNLLREAQLIEMAGSVYTAKMVLLAEEQAQRELYSYFAADEARHLRLITDLIGAPDYQFSKNPFFDYLSLLIQEESRLPLVFVIQVLLEGWGIHHYGNLASASTQPRVTDVFRSILHDEGKHHGSGLILFDESALTEEEFVRCGQALKFFVEIIRIGPVSVAQELAKVASPWCLRTLEAHLRQIDFQGKVRSELELIRSLLKRAKAHRLLAQATQENLFLVPNANAGAEKMMAIFGGQG